MSQTNKAMKEAETAFIRSNKHSTKKGREKQRGMFCIDPRVNPVRRHNAQHICIHNRTNQIKQFPLGLTDTDSNTITVGGSSHTTQSNGCTM